MAVARPMPELPPVTSATFPAKVFILGLLFLLAGLKLGSVLVWILGDFITDRQATAIGEMLLNPRDCRAPLAMTDFL
jgi:hypothetical protein